MRIKSVWCAIRCAFSFGALVFTLQIVNGDSYQITVPARGADPATTGKFFAAWHFQTKTVTQAFPPASYPAGMQLSVWNDSSQSYTTLTLDDIDGWLTNPDFNLDPGVSFFIWNPSYSDLTVTFTGTPLTGAVSKSLTANYYFSGAAKKIPGSTFECVCTTSMTGMSYPGTDGDQLWYWNPDTQAWVLNTRQTVTGAGTSWSGYCNGGIVGLGAQGITSSTLPGWGSFLKPVNSKTWTFNSLTTCN